VDGGVPSVIGRVATTIVLVTAGALALPPSPMAAQQPGHGTVPAGLDLYMPTARSTVPTGDIVVLGRALFFDPILSRDSSVACATCHDPARAFSDGNVVAEGVDHRRGRRNVPAIINRGYGRAFFWDGRVRVLEAQPLLPIQSPMEMDADLETVLRRLTAHGAYRGMFRATHGSDPDTATLARSLAAYVRTIRSGNSRFDRFVDEGASDALSAQEQRGLRLFQGSARCSHCHLGPNLTDERFRNTGVAFVNGALRDSGRAAVTGRPEDLGAFKVPTLREVARTAPYMHDGGLATLDDVIAFYDRGGNPNRYQDSTIRPLHLIASDREALVAFLGTLSGEVVEGVRRER